MLTVFCVQGPLPYRYSAQEREQSETSWPLEFFWHFLKSCPFALFVFLFHIELYVKYTRRPSSWYSKPYAHVHVLFIPRRIPQVQKCTSIVNTWNTTWRTYKRARVLHTSGFFLTDLMSVSSPETTPCGQLHSGAVCVCLCVSRWPTLLLCQCYFLECATLPDDWRWERCDVL